MNQKDLFNELAELEEYTAPFTPSFKVFYEVKEDYTGKKELWIYSITKNQDEIKHLKATTTIKGEPLKHKSLNNFVLRIYSGDDLSDYEFIIIDEVEKQMESIKRERENIKYILLSDDEYDQPSSKYLLMLVNSNEELKDRYTIDQIEKMELRLELPVDDLSSIYARLVNGKLESFLMINY